MIFQQTKITLVKNRKIFTIRTDFYYCSKFLFLIQCIESRMHAQLKLQMHITWSHSSRSLKKKVESATSKIIRSISVAKFCNVLTSFWKRFAYDPVNSVWNKINVSSKSQMKTRSTWDSGSGLWLFRRLLLRDLEEDFRPEIYVRHSG